MGKDKDKDDLSDLLRSAGYVDEDFDGDVDWYDVDLHDQEIKELDKILHPRRTTIYDVDEDEDEDDMEDDWDDDNTEDELYSDDEGDIDDEDDEAEEEDNYVESGGDAGQISLHFSVSVNTKKPEPDGGVRSRREDAEGALSYLTSCDTLDAEDKLRMRRCRFILEGKCVAARFCDESNGFQLVEAVAHAYGLPREFLDYYSTDGIILDVMKKIAEYDIDLAIRVWVWLIKEFTPYAEYDEEGVQDITTFTLGYIDEMPDGFRESFYAHIKENPEFFLSVIRERDSIVSDYEQFIYMAIRDKDEQLTIALLQAVLDDSKIKMSDKAELVAELGECCCNYDSMDEIEAFSAWIIPILKDLKNPLLDKKILQLQKDIAEYTDTMADENPKYEFSYKNAWRLKYKDGPIDPTYYSDEKEFLEACREEGIAIETAASNVLKEAQERLNGILRSIKGNAIGEGNVILITHILDSADKICRFCDWIEAHIAGGVLTVSEAEVAKAAIEVAQ